jgi:hypothetical protein
LVFITFEFLSSRYCPGWFDFDGAFAMAFLSIVAKNVTGSLAQGIGNSFMLDKKDVSSLSKLIRDNTKRHWKPLLAVGAAGALAYGAYKVRTEIQQQIEDTKAHPTPNEVRNLTHTANSVDGNCGPDLGMVEYDSLVDDLLLSLENEPELEDCLENDPAASEDVRWSSSDREVDIVNLKIQERKYEIGLSARSDEVDEESPRSKSKEVKPDPVIQQLKAKKVLITQEAYHKEQYRKQRKRVRSGQLSNAIRGLAAKIRASFPLPDGSMLQQKAMCLYAAKECRKMCIREAQIATIVPKAVSLASIPTTSQVDLRQITKIEAVELKYKKMAWSGYKNKQGWASHLASLFA